MEIASVMIIICVMPWNSCGQNEFSSVFWNSCGQNEFLSVFQSHFLDPYVFQNFWLLHPTVILQRKLFFMVENLGRKWMMGDLGSTNPTIGRYSILLPIKLYQLTLCLKPHHERNFRGGRILSQDFHHLFCLTNLQRR